MHFKAACVCDVDLSFVVSFCLIFVWLWNDPVLLPCLSYSIEEIAKIKIGIFSSLTSAKRPNFFRSCRYPLFLWSRLGSEKCKATAAKDSEDDAPNQSLDLGTRPADGTQLVTSFFESPKFSTTKKRTCIPGFARNPPPHRRRNNRTNWDIRCHPPPRIEWTYQNPFRNKYPSLKVIEARMCKIN